MQDLNASKGVFFTTQGYQSGAEIYAKAKGIDIFVVRELTDKEWGLPGKIVDFYLQIVSKTILNIEFENTKGTSLMGLTQINNKLSLEIGKENGIKHPILSKHKDKHSTLEDCIEAASEQAIDEIKKKSFLLNNGEECTRYLKINVHLIFKDELQVLNGITIIFIPKIHLSVGIKVNQSRLVFDRSKNFIYSLAIEDCINNEVYAAHKDNQEKKASWIKVENPTPESIKDSLINGSIFFVVTKGYFDPTEMKGLKEAPINK